MRISKLTLNFIPAEACKEGDYAPVTAVFDIDGYDSEDRDWLFKRVDALMVVARKRFGAKVDVSMLGHHYAVLVPGGHARWPWVFGLIDDLVRDIDETADDIGIHMMQIKIEAEEDGRGGSYFCCGGCARNVRLMMAAALKETEPSMSETDMPDISRTYLKIADRARSAINVG